MVKLAIVAMLLGVAHADAPKKPGKGFWRVLAQPNQKWELVEWNPPDSAKPDHAPNKLTITTYDVRKLDGADVARLKWSLNGSDDNALQFTNAGPLTQIAVTDAGAYLFYASADDAKIRAALKGKPSRSDPPKPYRATKLNEGRYLTVQDGLVCMGYEPLPDAPECEEVCGASVCIAADEGIVMLDGSWAPEFYDYVAPNSKALDDAQKAREARSKLKKKRKK